MKICNKEIPVLSIAASFLLAMLICLNGIRCMLNITDSSMMINMLFVVFIGICAPRFLHRDNYRLDRSAVIYIFASVAVMVACVISGIAVKEYSSLFKFAVITVMGFCIILMSEEELRRTVRFAILICSVYVAYILTNTAAVNRYLRRGSNYLNVTLPIGLIMGVLLISGVYKLLAKRRLAGAGYLALAAVYMYALTKFSARGSIILPIVAVLFAAFLLGGHSLRKMAVVTVVTVVVGFVGYKGFVRYAGNLLTSRMSRLFSNVGTENRWQIWADYLKEIWEQSLWLIGGGTNYFVRKFGVYPHNYYMQMVGEFGLIGIFYSAVASIKVAADMLFVHRRVKRDSSAGDRLGFLYYRLLVALIYIFLTFMKSFSVYDASLLIIVVSMCIAMRMHADEEERIMQGVPAL